MNIFFGDVIAVLLAGILAVEIVRLKKRPAVVVDFDVDRAIKQALAGVQHAAEWAFL